MKPILAALGVPAATAEKWAEPLKAATQAYGISTPLRLAAFLGQCAHESRSFTRVEEDLDYSAHRLMEVWPARFPTAADAMRYAHNPEKLASRVYANRMGNGDELSRDGYRFRGRGPLMLTGRANYTEASQGLLKADRLVEFPDHVALDPWTGAAVSAWFWHARGCNELADARDFEALSRRINGGTVGLPDRIAKIDLALEVLA